MDKEIIFGSKKDKESIQTTQNINFKIFCWFNEFHKTRMYLLTMENLAYKWANRLEF